MKEKQKLQKKLNDIFSRLYNLDSSVRKEAIKSLKLLLSELDENQRLVVKAHLKNKMTEEKDSEVKKEVKLALKTLKNTSHPQKSEKKKTKAEVEGKRKHDVLVRNWIAYQTSEKGITFLYEGTHCLKGLKNHDFTTLDFFNPRRRGIISKPICEILLCRACGRYVIEIQYTISTSSFEERYTDFLVLKKTTEVEEFVKTKKYLELINTCKYWLLGDHGSLRVKTMDQYIEKVYSESEHIWCEAEC